MSDSKHILYLLELGAASLLGQQTSKDVREINSHLQTLENRDDKKRPVRFNHHFNGKTLMYLHLTDKPITGTISQCQHHK